MWHWRLDNDAENTAVHHRNKLHFKVHSYRKRALNCNNFNILLFLNTALIIMPDICQKQKVDYFAFKIIIVISIFSF